MATLNGAIALGMGDQIGSLSVGKVCLWSLILSDNIMLISYIIDVYCIRAFAAVGRRREAAFKRDDHPVGRQPGGLRDGADADLYPRGGRLGGDPLRRGLGSGRY